MTNIDNCTRPLDGAKLCQILTQPMVKFRILGKTGNPEVTNTLFVTATGNNLQIVGDATRRFVLCRQDAKTERPDLRTFTFDALEKARAHRGEFVQAALMVLRAAHVAGDAVPHGRPLAGYGGWCRLVRDALCWLGEADPLTSIETIREQDATLQTHAAVLQLWHEGLGEQPISAQGLIDYATERMVDADVIYRPIDAPCVSNFLHPELREALMGVAGDKGFIDLKRLSYWLRAKHGKPVEGLKIVKATTVRGMHQWKVVKEG